MLIVNKLADFTILLDFSVREQFIVNDVIYFYPFILVDESNSSLIDHSCKFNSLNLFELVQPELFNLVIVDSDTWSILKAQIDRQLRHNCAERYNDTINMGLNRTEDSVLAIILDGIRIDSFISGTMVLLILSLFFSKLQVFGNVKFNEDILTADIVLHQVEELILAISTHSRLFQRESLKTQIFACQKLIGIEI